MQNGIYLKIKKLEKNKCTLASIKVYIRISYLYLSALTVWKENRMLIGEILNNERYSKFKVNIEDDSIEKKM